jgi:hypothetical protein
MRPPWFKIWFAPIALATLIFIGLIAALVGEHLIWKACAWIGLGIPVATSVWFVWLRPRA